MMIWITIKEYVDTRTGEILTKRQVLKENLTEVRQIVSYSFKIKNHGTKHIFAICEPRKQYSIF